MAKSNSRRRNTAASAMNLPMDLITDILCRLPVKSIIRFKSVSKPWSSLIQNPIFIKLQTNFSKLNPHPVFSSILSVDKTNTNVRLNLIDSLDKPINMDFPFMHGRQCRVFGISNGLLCLMVGGKYYFDVIIICNPVTGNFRKIPPFKPMCWTGDNSFYGFNSNEDGFELVNIDFSYSSVKVVYFSSSSNIWKDVKVKMGKDVIHNERTAVLHPFSWGQVSLFKDGVFYWDAYENCDDYVLSFDVFNKVLDEISLPYGGWYGLVELNEQLVAIDIGIKEINIWTLNENDKTWKMFKSIDLGDSIPEYGPATRVTFLGCTGNGKLVLEHYDYPYSNSKLYLYDMDTDETNSLHYVNVEGIKRMYLFAESLAAVETGDFGDEV